MSRLRKKFVGLLLATLLLTASGCSKLRARHELSKGTQAYKNANYEQAIEHFKNAVSLDGKLGVAKLYLATAYSQQYVPGVDNSENISNAERAIEAFRSVLAEDPKERHALRGIADLYASMKNYDDARQYYERAIAANPDDADNYYSVGVLDWTAVYRDIADRKGKLGLGMAEQLTDKQICDQIRTTDGPRIEEAIKMLETSLAKRPDDEAARNYMHLLDQRKADMECSDPQASGKDKVLDKAKPSS